MQEATPKERFIGVDLHKETMVVTRLLADGSRAGKTEHYPTTKEGLGALRGSCGLQDHVVVEATYHWALFAEAFDDFEGELALAHPLKNRLIAESRNKNDKVDSKVLADLLRTNFLARAWIAPKEIREARELLRYRASLVRIQTSLKNRARALLAKAGQAVAATDLFSAGGLRELAALNLGRTRNLIVRNLVGVARALRKQLAETEVEIARRVKLSAEARLVDGIKGFGALSALTIMSEIGDIRRFASARKLVSYAGLAPVNRASGGVLRHGPISKQGSPWLRWILVEGTQHALEAYPQLAALYRRVTANQGQRKNAGRIAVARQLLVSIYHMLKRGEPFRPERIGRASAQAGGHGPAR
jgi:transposase